MNERRYLRMFESTTFKSEFFVLVMFLFVACGKNSVTPVYKNTRLKKVFSISFDKSTSAIDIIRTSSGDYVINLLFSAVFEGNLYKLDSDLNLMKEFHPEHKIVDIAELPDGSFIASHSYGGDGETVMLIDEDLTQLEYQTVSLPYAPNFEVTDDGIIMVSANLNLSGTKVVKFNFEFEEIWSTDIPNLSSFTNEYSIEMDEIYVVEGFDLVHCINGTTGEIERSLYLSTEIWDVTYHEGKLYIAGRKTDGTLCGKDIEILKLDVDGKMEWRTLLGRKDASDAVGDILVNDEKVFFTGIYGEDNCLQGISGNYSDLYFAELCAKDGNLKSDKVKGITNDSDYGASLVMAPNGNVYVLCGMKNTETSRNNPVIYEAKVK